MEEELEELEEVPRRRPWLVVAIVILAGILILSLIQTSKARSQYSKLKEDVVKVEKERDSFKIQLADSNVKVEELQKEIASLKEEKRVLSQKLADDSLSKASSKKPTTKKEAETPKKTTKKK